MNNTNLIGRITADLELKTSQSNKSYTRFTLAVNRNFTNEKGEKEADFISCVAWEKTAENMCKFVKKGHKVGITGRIQTGSYEREDGSRVYTTDVIVNHLEFLETKPKEERPAPEYVEPVKQEQDEDPFASFGEQLKLEPSDIPFE